MSNILNTPTATTMLAVALDLVAQHRKFLETIRSTILGLDEPAFGVKIQEKLIEQGYNVSLEQVFDGLLELREIGIVGTKRIEPNNPRSRAYYTVIVNL